MIREIPPLGIRLAILVGVMPCTLEGTQLFCLFLEDRADIRRDAIPAALFRFAAPSSVIVAAHDGVTVLIELEGGERGDLGLCPFNLER